MDEQEAEADDLREQIEAADLPEHARKQADRELQRFERLPPQSAEHGVIRTYLEWLAELPWATASEDNLDLRRRARELDTTTTTWRRSRTASSSSSRCGS